MPTWSGCECVNTGLPWAKSGMLLLILLPANRGLIWDVGGAAPGSCVGPRVGVMGLTGGREGDDARDPRRPAAGCGFGGGGCGCEPAPAPVLSLVAPATGVPPVVMVSPGMTTSDRDMVAAMCRGVAFFFQ